MLQNVVYSFVDEEEYKNLIRAVIRQFRHSNEYKMWLNLYNRDTCAATGLDKFNDGVEIELHHFGTTLWGWVESVIDMFYEMELPFNTFIICNVLADLHLSRCIPCIPISKDTHNQIHTNEEETINKYPHILKNVNSGNINRAHDIIIYHAKIIKKLLEEEKRL